MEVEPHAAVPDAGTARAQQPAWRFLQGRTPSRALGLLLLVVVALYGQYLWNPILFDDTHLFLLDAAGNLPVSQQQFDFLGIRSLPNATLAWTLALFGRELIYFRLGNLLLQVAVVISVYGCIQQLRAASALHNASPTTSPDRSVAFAAALLFAVHPVAVYAVGYLAQRTILMATLFAVLALWSYARGCTPWQARWHWLWLWLSVPLYYLSAFSKEHAVTLVLLFPLLTVLLCPDWRAGLRRARWVLLALALLALAVVLLHARATKGPMFAGVYEIDAATLLSQTPLDHPYLSSVLTQCALFFKYAGLWLLPNPAWMSVDMREPLAAGWDMTYAGAVALYLLWGAVGLLLVARRGRAGFVGLALLFPWLMGWTEFSTVRVQEPFVLYRSYLWAAGAVCAAAVLPAPLRGPRGLALLVLMVAILFGLSMERLHTFSHPLLLWDDAEKLVHGRADRPGAARIYYNRGTILLKAKQLPLAVEDLQQALQLQPHFPQAAGNLGACYVEAAQWELAAASFSRAIEINGNTGEASEGIYYQGRARAEEHQNLPQQARLDYATACRIAGIGCDQEH